MCSGFGTVSDLRGPSEILLTSLIMLHSQLFSACMVGERELGPCNSVEQANPDPFRATHNDKQCAAANISARLRLR